MMKNKPEIIRQWISSINDLGRGLTGWEISFMEFVTDQFDRKQYISERQEAVLERIYAEKTP